MKTKLVLLFSVLYSFCHSQDSVKKSFENLSTIEIGRFGDIIESVSFDATISTVYDKKYRDLDSTDPFYMDECDGDYRKLIRTKLDRNSTASYIISYNESCCCSYGFTIYEDNNPDKSIGFVNANRMYIPGNGAIYTEGRLWQTFTKRQKFILSRDTIEEIKQPFNYVGLKTKANSTIKLYAELELKTHIASIPKDYEIEVILKPHETEQIYLVRTSFGMVGWAKIAEAQYHSQDVEGIYYWGD